MTLPKTIDNDVAGTDATFGFTTALEVATEAIDRLHSTAHSHHRIIVAEVMGHRAGWLALGAGLAGGADVILIPEIPYSVACDRGGHQATGRGGARTSASSPSPRAPGASRTREAMALAEAPRRAGEGARGARGGAKAELALLEPQHAGNTLRLAHQLEQLTGLESRVSILGYIQRGGTPSPVDRLLATRLGSAAADLVEAGTFGVMVAATRRRRPTAVPLEEVAGRRKRVPPDHAWVAAARHVGTCLGD